WTPSDIGEHPSLYLWTRLFRVGVHTWHGAIPRGWTPRAPPHVRCARRSGPVGRCSRSPAREQVSRTSGGMSLVRFGERFSIESPSAANEERADDRYADYRRYDWGHRWGRSGGLSQGGCAPGI